MQIYGAVYIAPTKHDQAPRRIQCETQGEIRDMDPQEPQDSLFRNRIPR